MSWLGKINKYFLQFFFIRLTRHTEKVKVNYIDYSRMKSTRYQTETYYSIQYWILPFTGWTNDFIYLNKSPKFVRLTDNKKS